MVAPAGKDWWNLVRGMTSQSLNLKSVKVPDNARWVGYSSGNAIHSSDPYSKNMTVAYIGLPNVNSAQRLVSKIRKEVTQISVDRLSNVVVIVPSSVDRNSETFPKKAPVISDRVTVGSWRMNLTADSLFLAADSKFAPQFKDFVSKLGISMDAKKPTMWEATSTSADKWWKGDLTGFSAGTANVANAVSMLSSTARVSCASTGTNGMENDTCFILSNGLQDLLESARFEQDGKVSTNISDSLPIGEKSDVFSGFIIPDEFRAYAIGNSANQNPALKQIDFRFVSSDSLHIRPVFNR